MTREQALTLADSLEVCANPACKCDLCQFDKVCDKGEQDGVGVNILREAAKAIRELSGAMEYQKTVDAHMRETNAARSLDCDRDDRASGRGWDWQVGLYQRVIDKYGAEKQVTKAIEELGELTVELSRGLLCGFEDQRQLSNLREELADVNIMCDQLQLIFGDVSDWEMHKLERLERNLEAGLL